MTPLYQEIRGAPVAELGVAYVRTPSLQAVVAWIVGNACAVACCGRAAEVRQA